MADSDEGNRRVLVHDSVLGLMGIEPLKTTLDNNVQTASEAFAITNDPGSS